MANCCGCCGKLAFNPYFGRILAGSILVWGIVISVYVVNFPVEALFKPPKKPRSLASGFELGIQQRSFQYYQVVRSRPSAIHTHCINRSKVPEFGRAEPIFWLRVFPWTESTQWSYMKRLRLSLDDVQCPERKMMKKGKWKQPTPQFLPQLCITTSGSTSRISFSSNSYPKISIDIPWKK